MRRYIVGHPGQPPRTIMAVNEDQLACNVLDGEVAFEQADYPPPPHRIDAAGTSLVAVEPSLDDAREDLWRRIKTECERHKDGGCVTPKGRAQSDEASRALIQGAIATAAEGIALGLIEEADFAEVWTMADNSEIAHSLTELRAMGVAIGLHVSTCYARRRQLRAAKDAATSLADLDAIDITAGYPA